MSINKKLIIDEEWEKKRKRRRRGEEMWVNLQWSTSLGRVTSIKRIKWTVCNRTNVRRVTFKINFCRCKIFFFFHVCMSVLLLLYRSLFTERQILKMHFFSVSVSWWFLLLFSNEVIILKGLWLWLLSHIEIDGTINLSHCQSKLLTPTLFFHVIWISVSHHSKRSN